MNQILLALVVVANLVVVFTKAAASAARINEIFDTKPSVDDAQNKQVSDVKGAPCVEYRHVSFRYYEGAAEALKDIHLSIKAGESVGIIGGTGSSKSTLVQLIPRLYDASQGTVLVDGTDVKEYPLPQLHQKIGMVPQGNLLFSGTIRENLQWQLPNATEEQLWAALETAQAAEFVRKLPLGLDAPVSQGGANFSGGQKQRLTIARALVGHPEILILDDSSSALDYATDAALQQAIHRMSPMPTVLIVSQRVSTVKRCDRILVMDEGEIVGDGKHEDLLKDCLTYQEICYSQMSAQEAQA